MYTFYQSSRTAQSLQDEDIQFPLTIQRYHKAEVKDILLGLSECIEKAGQGKDPADASIVLHFKFIKALLSIVGIKLDEDYRQAFAQEA